VIAYRNNVPSVGIPVHIIDFRIFNVSINLRALLTDDHVVGL
jgi:hypothetical protein